jgi:UPF0176 protein
MSAENKPIMNISAYLFKSIDESSLPAMRKDLLDKCRGLSLKGTILISPEGINAFLAGEPAAVNRALAFIDDLDFKDLPVKISYSDAQPFNRMLVRIKKEIIAFGLDQVQPADHTAPHLAPEDLHKWYQDGEDMLVLDTRNDYEVKMGKFKDAFDFDIRNFREFPERIKELKEKWADKPVVTYCTGGVRCEKAAEYMLQEGFNKVYQLDGGILNYFDKCGGDNYEGDCFVFDSRVALNPQQEQTDAVVCYACREPMQLSEKPADDICPFCSKSMHGRRGAA